MHKTGPPTSAYLVMENNLTLGADNSDIAGRGHTGHATFLST